MVYYLFNFTLTQEAAVDILPYWIIIRILVNMDDVWGSYYLSGTEQSW